MGLKLKIGLLLLGQFSILGYWILFEGLFLSGIAFGLQILALLPGIWALIVIPPKWWRVSPAPAAEGELIIKGPYRIIRHPMYGTLLLLVLIHVGFQPQLKTALLGLGLLLVLLMKIKLEEGLLVKAFPAYAHYQGKSYALIPGVY
jgi:protein-S-isoprenylcysteine O-methyltransferase Ste14